MSEKYSALKLIIKLAHYTNKNSVSQEELNSLLTILSTIFYEKELSEVDFWLGGLTVIGLALIADRVANLKISEMTYEPPVKVTHMLAWISENLM